MRHTFPVIALVLALVGCGKTPAVTNLSRVAPEFKMTAEEYKLRAADEKYRGKVIELTGTVEDASRNAGGDAFVQLKTGDDWLGVMCFTDDERPWATVARGQQVRIKGYGGGAELAPRLLACIFVDVGTYTAIQITAPELAKEYAENPDATVKKYDKKHMAITGEIEAKNLNEVKAVGLVLKTGNKVKVECGFTAFDKDLSEQYAVGQTVTVFGEFSLNGGDTVHLNFCLPLSTK